MLLVMFVVIILYLILQEIFINYIHVFTIVPSMDFSFLLYFFLCSLYYLLRVYNTAHILASSYFYKILGLGHWSFVTTMQHKSYAILKIFGLLPLSIHLFTYPFRFTNQISNWDLFINLMLKVLMHLIQ